MSCKTINIDLANVPPVPLQIGVAGENAFRTITFDASKWGAGYPDATYTVVYRRSDGYLYPVLVNASADAIVWNPAATDTAVSGNGQLEVRLLDGETIGKTIIMQTYVAPSLSGDESEPSTPAPDWVNDVAADADRAEAAVSHYPKIVDGVWFVWDAAQSEFVSTGISAQGEGGVSPTVTVEAIDGGHRVTITDADGAHTFDVMDGDSAAAENAVLYTPQTLTTAQQAQARENIGAGTYSKPSGGIPDSDIASAATWNAKGTYSKPSGGIPKSDLASAVQTSLGKADTALQSAPVTSVNNKTGAVTLGASDVHALPDSTVIPTVPQMATQTDMNDWTSGKTVDASAVKTVVSDKQNAPLEIPVTESDGTYSTTVTAEQIRAAKENSVFVFNGEMRIKALLWLPWGEGVALLIGFQMLSGTIMAVIATVTANNVAITVEQTPIPTAVSELTNDSGYQTASDVQTAISGVRQLPAATASDNGKFLRVVNGAWAAETVQTYQGGSY